MKKYLKMIGNIIFYGGLYFAIQFILSALYGFTYVIIHGPKGIKSFGDAIVSNIYLITAIAAVITFIIYILVLKNTSRNLWERCNFRKIKGSYIGNSVLIAISTALFSTSLVHFMSSKFESYNQVSKTILGAYGSVLSMTCIIVVIPMFEEILFRGLIFNELKKNVNVVIAIVVQALLFALFHGNMIQGIYTFIFGVILSLLYIYTKSIWTNIICHIVYNLCGSLIIPICLPSTNNYVAVYLGIGIIGTIVLLINILKKHSKTIIIN